MECLICQRNFSSEKAMNMHVKQSHNLANYEDYYNKYIYPIDNIIFIDRVVEKSVECKLCGSKFESIQSISNHLRFNHKDYTIKQYYDEFIRGENEGVCQCGCETRFLNIAMGYNSYCSNSCIGKHSDIIHKKSETCLVHHGVDNPMKSEMIKDKYKSNNFKKYGHEWPMQRSEVIDKTRSACMVRYGVDYPPKVKSVRDKVISTCLQKYGVKSPLDIETNRNISYIQRKSESYNNFCRFSDVVIPLFTFDEFVYGDRPDEMYKWKCVSCGYEFEFVYSCGRTPRCLKCHPYISSYCETEVFDFVESITFDHRLVRNNRSLIPPYELDIIDHTVKIAIEYDGLYWHSEKQLGDNQYHYNKLKMTNAVNYRLIHIFEDEWLNKQNIVKSRLKSIFGKIDHRIYARKCIIKEISHSDKKSFLNNNHIQGNDISAVYLGCYYENDLCGVMTFSKLRRALGHRHQVDNWELSRYCSLLDCSVVGGASKLLSYFIKNYQPKYIISYADMRWSDGGLYKSLNFRLDHISTPGYWYVDKNNNRVHRYAYRKNQLYKIFGDSYDDALTEWENMKLNGYDRIWDCGNMVFHLEISE